jgi:hypothetical protein
MCSHEEVHMVELPDLRVIKLVRQVEQERQAR